MAKSKGPQVKAGSFSLSEDVNLLSYATSGEGLNTINVRQLISSINLYESFKLKFLSGNIQLVDSIGVIEKLPLTGHESIEFKLNTPGGEKSGVYDFTKKTGFPMHVYKISDVKQLNANTKTYILHFCSKELIRNFTEVVDVAKKGEIHKMVVELVRDKLESKKDIIVEPTVGLRKYVFPRMKPLEAIAMIGEEAESDVFNNTGYRFFETRYGLNFRSLETMFSYSDKTPKKAKANFYDAPKGRQGDYASNYEKVNGWSVESRFDTLHNLKNGVYSSKLVALDGLTKTFKENNYSFQDDFAELTHVGIPDKISGNKLSGRDHSFLPEYNYKGDGKTLSAFPEANTYLQFSSSGAFTEKDGEFTVKEPYKKVPIEDMLQRQKGQQFSLQQNKITIDVPGNTTLCIGDVVGFSTVIKVKEGGATSFADDPYVSGNYLISDIQHSLNVIDGVLSTKFTLLKDCVSTPYKSETKLRTLGKGKGELLSIYSIDKQRETTSWSFFGEAK